MENGLKWFETDINDRIRWWWWRRQRRRWWWRM